MTNKINYKQINQFRQTGVLKLKNFFEKNEISKLKENILKKIKSKNSFDSYYEKINGKRLLRRIEKLSKNSKDFHKEIEAKSRLTENMAEKIAHRGPDDKGYLNDENISLGFRRLSILDVKNGNQPVFSSDKSIISIFNGEIYN